KPLTNFYGILIRKQDFSKNSNNPNQKGVRILTRMPYLPLNQYQFLRKELAEHSWTIAENARDYFYQSALLDNSVKSWKQRVEHYLDRGAIPLPILRGNEQTWQQLTEQVQQDQQITIQSAKSEQSIIPLELSEKLVYLLGVIDGDGHLSKHQVHIVDYSKKQIEQLQQFFQELFGVTGNIREGKDGNYYILLVNGKWIVRLVNFITGHPLGRKYESLREPLILREKPYEHLRGAYWRGMFDADASYKNSLSFTSISKSLIEDLKNYLTSLHVKHCINHSKNGYTLYINAGSRQSVFNMVNCWHPEKKKEFVALLSRRHNGEIEDFQGINKQKLTIEGFFDFTFLDRKIVVHNAGSLLKQLREQKNISRRQLASVLQVAYSTLAAYENSRANPSMKVMLAFAAIMNEPLLSLLQRKNLDCFGLISSVKLPFKPSQKLLQLMRYIHPRANNYISLLTADSVLIQKIECFFSIKILRPELKRFNNFVLWHFLDTFGNYENIK
ncbi:MAG: helix-turn-helix domain-containing protein, partial [Candidatus Heimdallarchaeota archaeon]